MCNGSIWFNTFRCESHSNEVRAVLLAFFCIDRTIFLDLKLSGGAQFGLLMAAIMVRNPHVEMWDPKIVDIEV